MAMHNEPYVMPALQNTGQVVNVSGALSFDTVLEVRERGIAIIQQQSKTVFDFSKVTKTDSAAVALLLEWWRAAAQLKKTIQFKSLPQSMQALIKVASLGVVLGSNII